MLVQKLPKLFQANPLILKLAEFMQGKKVLFSSLVYVNQGKKYIVNKNAQTPYFEKDWQCYSFFRCYAKTLITTGSIIRYEKGLFQSYFACGDKEIEQMYRNFKHNDKQNVYLMTNTMTKEEVMPHFNTDIYNVLMSDSFKQPSANKNHLTQIIEGLIKDEQDPLLVECGPVVMKQFFDSVSNGQSKNLIDGAYIAYFEGNLPEHSIGRQFWFDQTLFDTVWESEAFIVEWKGQQIGKLTFRVFKGKTTL